MHRAHHVGVRVERAAREADVGRAVVAEALHRARLRPHSTPTGQPAAQRLAVGDHVGAHAEVLLRAARREPEADEHLVEDQHDPALGADLAQSLAANRCRRRDRSARCAPLSTSVESPGALAFGCSACSGFTSTQAMSRRRAQHAQRVLVHVLERVGVAGRRRIADARLHVAPPAVVGAAEAHQVRCAACDSAPAAPPASPPRCPTCGTTPRRARRSRAAGCTLSATTGWYGPSTGPERAHALGAALDALLVEVVAEDVDAVGAGQVVEAGCRRGR